MNIFEFSDYRRYLKAWIEQARQAKTSNLSRLAEVAQVHPTFLSHVLTGTKELSLEQAAFVSEHLQHTKLEQDYFFTLIQLDRAGTSNLKKYWQEKKAAIEAEKNRVGQRFHKHRELTDEQRTTFYSSWMYVAAWVCTAIDGGQTLSQIAERFHISRNRAEEILLFLVQCGICNEDDGVFSIGETHVHVPNESPHVTKHHVNWRMRGIQRMDTRDSKELFFTSPMSISHEDFAEIREKLMVAIQDIINTAKESPAEDLFCLNIDFFAQR